MKKLGVITLLATMACSPAVLAAQSTQAEINELKKRISVLEMQDGINETRNFTIGTGMQFGVGSGTYADELYIIDFGLNRDLSLLHERQYITKKYKSFERAPHLLVSGDVQASVGKHSERFGISLDDHEQFMKASIEMDFTGMINEDWLGYVEFTGDGFGDDTGMFVDQVFTTYGNFDKSPVYITLGYQYVPFGNFTTNFIESTVVQELGRIQVPAANAAFNVLTEDRIWEVNGAFFWFDGNTKNTDEFTLNEVGANLQARRTQLGPQKDMTLMAGVSYVNNLASSNGIEDFVEADGIDKLHQYTPAVDARAKFTKGPFSLTAEYLTAIRAFSELDYRQVNGSGSTSSVQPNATYVEAAVDYKLWGMPNTFSARWGETNEALAFGLPEEEYGLSYQLAPFFNTRITFEWMHQMDYSEGNTVIANNGLGSTTVGTDEIDDVFQAQINVFF
jgi:hypothetical protein